MHLSSARKTVDHIVELFRIEYRFFVIRIDVLLLFFSGKTKFENTVIIIPSAQRQHDQEACEKEELVVTIPKNKQVPRR
jgi:hypothetical protein